MNLRSPHCPGYATARVREDHHIHHTTRYNEFERKTRQSCQGDKSRHTIRSLGSRSTAELEPASKGDCAATDTVEPSDDDADVEACAAEVCTCAGSGLGLGLEVGMGGVRHANAMRCLWRSLKYCLASEAVEVPNPL